MEKTNSMKRIERQYGKKIEEILRELYVEQEMTIEKIAEELIVSPATAYDWLKKANIRTRKMTFI